MFGSDRANQYLSHLFDNIGRVNVYIVEGQRYRKEVGYGKFNTIGSKNNGNEQMIQFMPYQERSYNNIISQPRLSNITHIGMPQKNFNKSSEEIRFPQTNKIIKIFWIR